jgi:glycoprotease/Kae1 family metallohydrolase
MSLNVLAIESSAHTLGMSVARRRAEKIEILSNCTAKYPSLKEGYIPRKLAESHAKNMRALLEETISKAKIKFSDIDFVAYTRGPGMGHCLSVGADAARALGSDLGIPVIGVNHALAHAEIVRYLSGAKDSLVVYVSGGNTQILCIENSRYHVLGETLDMGIGNFLDMLGRSLCLTPPDAVGVLTLAAQPDCRYVPMPYVVKGMSVSYSGMLTFAQKLAKAGTASPKDICYSAQETAFAALCEATERALLLKQKKEIVLCGGNGRNKRLAQMLGLVASENDARLCIAADEYLGDNAAMIALTALLMAGKAAPKKDANLGVAQDLRMDSEPVYWIGKK